MKKKTFKTILIAGAAAAGIAYAACVIWTIYDSMTGGPSRWYHLIPMTMGVLLMADSVYRYFKDEKSRK